MKTSNQRQYKRERRRKRIRAKGFGTVERPRLSIFRSNRYIYAQIINDETGMTLAAASSREMSGKKKEGNLATEVGKEIAAAAKGKKIAKVAFDCGRYVYRGKIKAVPEGARAGGLEL